MYKPCATFLVESDPSESELVNPGEYRENTSPVEGDVGSTPGGVGSSEARGGCFHIVLRATIAGGDDKREIKTFPKGIQSVEEIDGHFYLTATTSAGELVRLEILPEHGALFPIT